jgi:hypothetical protein
MKINLESCNMRVTKKLVVLDHGEQTVTVYPYDENVWGSPEDFTDEDGHYVLDSNCQWMVVDDLNIKIF